MSRKQRYTPELAQQVIDGVLAGLTNKDAAEAAGISERTLYRWTEGLSGAPLSFATQVTETKARRTLYLFRLLNRAALGRLDPDHPGHYLVEPNLQAALELIDRCHPEYRKTGRMEVAIDPMPPPSRDEGPDVSRLTAQEQVTLAELLDKMARPAPEE